VSPNAASIVLHIDEAVYSCATVLRAAYWFTDRCYVFVSRPRPGLLDISISPKDVNDDISAIRGEFENSLVEYELRRLIQEETGRIRELLVAKAVGVASSVVPPRLSTSGDATK
jgi:His-Xaa-Ser system protein HxsD